MNYSTIWHLNCLWCHIRKLEYKFKNFKKSFVFCSFSWSHWISDSASQQNDLNKSVSGKIIWGFQYCLKMFRLIYYKTEAALTCFHIWTSLFADGWTLAGKWKWGAGYLRQTWCEERISHGKCSHFTRDGAGFESFQDLMDSVLNMSCH